MSYDIKDIFKAGLLVFIYVMFGIIGIYSASVIFFLPLLATPMTIYLMSKKENEKIGIAINIVSILIILLLSKSAVEAIWYTLNVTVPAYIMAFLYRKKFNIPQIVIYTATALTGFVCIYVIGFKYLGIDYIAIYYELLEAYQSVQLEVFSMASQYGFNNSQIELLKEVIQTQIDILKKVYPALLFILMIWLMILKVSIITIVGKLKKWRMTSLKELVEFKWSKVSVILFIMSFILIQGGVDQGSIWGILGWNIFFLINSLYQFIGIISIITLIKRSRLNKFMKVLGGVLGVILMYSSPSMLMIFGLLDTVFNYRKVTNIV